MKGPFLDKSRSWTEILYLPRNEYKGPVFPVGRVPQESLEKIVQEAATTELEFERRKTQTDQPLTLFKLPSDNIRLFPTLRQPQNVEAQTSTRVLTLKRHRRFLLYDSLPEENLHEPVVELNIPAAVQKRQKYLAENEKRQSQARASEQDHFETLEELDVPLQTTSDAINTNATQPLPAQDAESASLNSSQPVDINPVNQNYKQAIEQPFDQVKESIAVQHPLAIPGQAHITEQQVDQITRPVEELTADILSLVTERQTGSIIQKASGIVDGIGPDRNPRREVHTENILEELLGADGCDISTPVEISSPSFSLPPQWVPVCATKLQIEQCDKTGEEARQIPEDLLKPYFERVVDILDHPLSGNADEYGVTVADKWNGSGKTIFLKRLFDTLQTKNIDITIAIITFEMDTENLLFDMIRRYGFRCQRMGAVLDETWKAEYGVFVRTQKIQPDTGQLAFSPKADLIFALDIRVLPTHPVFNKICGAHSNQQPVVWLVTLGSLEERAARDERSKTAWWVSDSEYRQLVRKPNQWTTAEQVQQINDEAVRSITEWITSNFNGVFEFRLGKTPLSNAAIEDDGDGTDVVSMDISEDGGSDTQAMDYSEALPTMQPVDQNDSPAAIDTGNKEQTQDTVPLEQLDTIRQDVTHSVPPEPAKESLDAQSKALSSQHTVTLPPTSQAPIQNITSSTSYPSTDIAEEPISPCPEEKNTDSRQFSEYFNKRIKELFQFHHLSSGPFRTRGAHGKPVPCITKPSASASRARNLLSSDDETYYSANESESQEPAGSNAEEQSTERQPSLALTEDETQLLKKLDALKVEYDREYQVELEQIKKLYEERMRDLQKKYTIQAAEIAAAETSKPGAIENNRTINP
ncbi:hypothetical protein DFQ28_004281 [Apophysomyces sp. BC1034]|nr:hypothetical protein DFQ30_011110 [Apophysomyces sp. BC1015]KAG0178506.1 hypothetical protein DFQ29_003381 [Apophysomyces sp. BC1021]KAG0193614.1 hypothetical protein DFQ28_004281 [Apophysomyces sp. BC1034]